MGIASKRVLSQLKQQWRIASEENRVLLLGVDEECYSRVQERIVDDSAL